MYFCFLQVVKIVINVFFIFFTKASSSKALIGDGKGNKRKIATPSSPTEEDGNGNRYGLFVYYTNLY